MKILLDAHALLWFDCDSDQLSVKAHSMMTDSTNELYLSIATLWEIGLKINIG